MAYEQRSKDEGMTPLPPELKARFDSWGMSRTEQDRFRDDLNGTCPTPEELARVVSAENPWAIVYGELQNRPIPPQSEWASTVEKRQGSGRSSEPGSAEDRFAEHSFQEQLREHLRRPEIIAANPRSESPAPSAQAGNGQHHSEPIIKGADPLFLEIFKRDYPLDQEGNRKFAGALKQFQVGLGLDRPDCVPERDLNPRNYSRYLAFQQEAQKRGIPL